MTRWCQAFVLMLVLVPAVFLLGAWLLVAAVRWWRPQVSRRAAVGGLPARRVS